MLNNKLKIIDFSQGIRATEIEHNFSALQEQLNKERISVAGKGISYGLDLSLENFMLHISEGCLIDDSGNEVYIQAENISIDKPVLIAKEESKKIIDDNNRIYLSEIPYANNRLTSSNAVDVSESGVTVTISNASGSTAIVNIASIDGNVINVDGKNLYSTLVDVNYNYTAKRRDVIFINKDYKLEYRKGITSSSPSIPELNKDEYIYIICYIEVDGMNKEINNTYKAKINIIKEFKSTRNVYTDLNNKLYLCGTPFDSIKVIHITEPKNPEVDTFWYDYSVNKLKVWRRTDTYEFADSYKYMSSDENNPQLFNTNIKYLYNNNQLKVYVNNKKLLENEWEEGSELTETEKQNTVIYSSQFKILKKLQKGDLVSYSITRYDGYEEWVAVSDSSYINCEEHNIWTPEMLENEILDKQHNLQFFFFDAKYQKNLLYAPGKNSLNIIIDQIPLHSDQFDEITMYDAITGPYAEEIKNKLIKYYNYSDNFDPDKINEEYENIGIGFKLCDPLDKPSYVEVKVSQKVNSNPLTKRFQRSATFIDEGNMTYVEYIKEDDNSIYQEPIFNTTVPFRYQENQLDVYLNGRLLERNTEYIEVAEENDLKGKTLNTFKILKTANIKDGDRVSYKVTTNVYSYDHVDGLLSGFETRLQDVEDIVKTTLDKVTNKSDYIDKKIDEVENQLDKLTNFEDSLDTKYIKNTDRIGKENLETSLFKGIADKLINETYSVDTVPCTLNITGICSVSDFVILYNVTGNKLLQRDSDYSILENGNDVELIVNSMSAENSTVYLTGIKFNRA